MKVEIPQIYWHGDRDRIMSIDFFPNSNTLVTCGGEPEDKQFIKIWEVCITESDNEEDNQLTITSNDNGSTLVKLSYNYFITGSHNSVVNVLRFSPDGKYLASAGDDQALIIWTLKKRPIEFGSNEERVLWSLHKLFRGHTGDIYDLNWSPDSSHIISGSVDNSTIIWSIDKGKGILSMKDHQHFVQGVSWDPRDEYIISQSADKSLNVYSVIKASSDKVDLKLKNISRIKHYTTIKEEISIGDDNNVNKHIVKTPFNFFASENQLPGFFRRLTWSPDGELFLAVGGVYNDKEKNKTENVVWGFLRSDLQNPSFMLPTISPATCVRFCPLIFKKEKVDAVEMIDLPYKLIFAIGTSDSVLIYSTQNLSPIYAVTNIHIMQITDLAWKRSEILCASSSDGYISFCIFEKNNLGVEESLENLPNSAKILYSQFINVDYNSLVSNLDDSNTQMLTVIKKVKKKEANEVNEVKVVKESQESDKDKDKDKNQQMIIDQCQEIKTEEKPKKRITPTVINSN